MLKSRQICIALSFTKGGRNWRESSGASLPQPCVRKRTRRPEKGRRGRDQPTICFSISHTGILVKSLSISARSFALTSACRQRRRSASVRAGAAITRAVRAALAHDRLQNLGGALGEAMLLDLMPVGRLHRAARAGMGAVEGAAGLVGSLFAARRIFLAGHHAFGHQIGVFLVALVAQEQCFAAVADEDEGVVGKRDFMHDHTPDLGVRRRFFTALQWGSAPAPPMLPPCSARARIFPNLLNIGRSAVRRHDACQFGGGSTLPGGQVLRRSINQRPAGPGGADAR